MASDSAPLFLIPTASEREGIARDLGNKSETFRSRSRLVGFGMVAAPARTAQLIAQLKPARVIVLGIAGTYDPVSCPVGAVRSFRQVASFGIGVGEGEHYLAPETIGFPQWDGDESTPALPPTLPLDALEDCPCIASAGPAASLLSVAAASASQEEAAAKLSLFPHALAEDMEGFGVAMACALANVPCAVIRAISNEVGERDTSLWKISGALAELARAVSESSLV